jgi:hypothetical protein
MKNKNKQTLEDFMKEYCEDHPWDNPELKEWERKEELKKKQEEMLSYEEKRNEIVRLIKEACYVKECSNYYGGKFRNNWAGLGIELYDKNTKEEVGVLCTEWLDGHEYYNNDMDLEVSVRYGATLVYKGNKIEVGELAIGMFEDIACKLGIKPVWLDTKEWERSKIFYKEIYGKK